MSNLRKTVTYRCQEDPADGLAIKDADSAALSVQINEGTAVYLSEEQVYDLIDELHASLIRNAPHADG